MTGFEAQKQLLRRALERPGSESSDFDLNPDAPPAKSSLRKAAVLIALSPEGVILTKRSSRLKHHPGQIAFPGGKIDEGDSGPVDAALREAEEEIGLPRNQVEILGQLESHHTVTGFDVMPVVAVVEQPFTERPEAGEVDEIFRAPLDHLMNPSNYLIEGRRWLGQKRFYYTVPWGPYYIWGATARMLRALADRATQ